MVLAFHNRMGAFGFEQPLVQLCIFPLPLAQLHWQISHFPIGEHDGRSFPKLEHDTHAEVSRYNYRGGDNYSYRDISSHNTFPSEQSGAEIIQRTNITPKRWNDNIQTGYCLFRLLRRLPLRRIARRRPLKSHKPLGFSGLR